MKEYQKYLEHYFKEEIESDPNDLEFDRAAPLEDDDCFMSPSGQLGSKTSVSCGGKFIGEFNSDEEALEAIRNWQDEHQWWPNIWFVSDHGNYTLIDRNGKEVPNS